MSIEITTVEVTYDGNAVASQYAYTFRIDNESAVEVYVSGVQKTLNTDYTVSGVGNTNGGTVSFVASLVPGSGTGNVKIFRNTDPVHAINYSEGGSLPVANAEASWDRLAMNIQEHRDYFERTIKIPRLHTASAWNATLPDPGIASTSSGVRVLVFRASGIALYNASLVSTVDPLTTQGDVLGVDDAGAPTAIAIGSTGGIFHVGASTGALATWGSGAASAGLLPRWTGSTIGWVSVGSAIGITTKGDILGFSTVPTRLPIGSAYAFLQEDTNEATGLKYTNMQPYGGVYGVYANYGTSTASTASLNAKLVLLRQPTTQEVVYHEPAAAVTVNVTGSQTVSEANKRDQAAAFGSGATVHVYFIWNGTTLATVASLGGGPNDPFNGPTLPTGYTHWAYIGTTIQDSSGEFVGHHQRGGHIYRVGGANILSGGTATSFTAVNQGTWVPQCAIAFIINIKNQNITSPTSGGYGCDVTLSLDGSTTFMVSAWTVNPANVGAAQGQGIPGGQITLPNYDGATPTQQFWYKVAATASGTSPSVTLDVLCYTVPNGE